MTVLTFALLVGLVLAAALPAWMAALQFLAAALHARRNHYGACRPHLPRVAVIIPAWNEAGALARTVEALMRQHYPRQALRVWVVDDASTDATPQQVAVLQARYGERVCCLRRAHGGAGKAHTLNAGLARVLADDWAQAVLVMDADVLLEADTLRRMTRHLADPQIGAVTAYIKEGSSPGNLVTQSVAFEYITAQAAARRAQNVLGALACLAGGAQLHTRANLERLGGRIDTGTLAEDTHTTFLTQLHGARVLFEPHAVAWAEEPPTLAALWRQRLRWARGNLQLTAEFASLWFRPWRHRGLGSLSFGLQWFALVLVPWLAIGSALALLTLHALDSALAWRTFALFWFLAAVPYLFVTVSTICLDPRTARRCWFAGLLYPGAVSLALMAVSFAPEAVRAGLHGVWFGNPDWAAFDALLLLLYSWPALSMLAAWLLVRAEAAGLPAPLRDLVLLVVGYGAVLCAVSLAAYLAEWRRLDRTWEKTEKTGKVRMLK